MIRFASKKNSSKIDSVDCLRVAMMEGKDMLYSWDLGKRGGFFWDYGWFMLDARDVVWRVF